MLAEPGLVIAAPGRVQRIGPLPLPDGIRSAAAIHRERRPRAPGFVPRAGRALHPP